MRRARGPHALLLGGALAILYLSVATLSYRSGLLPIRPLYEGTAPPAPYRWVSPPKDLAAGNVPPARGSGTVRFTPKGSEASAVATDDAQAIVAFQDGSIKPKAGNTSVKVDITPLDPATLAQAPADFRFDGNAYRIAAAYQPSGAPAEMAVGSCPTDQSTNRLCPTVVLRYPLHATDLFRLDGTSWTLLVTTPAIASLQVFTDTPALGIFVAAGPPRPVAPPPSHLGQIIGITLGAVAVAGSVAISRFGVARRMLRRRRKRRQTGRAGAPRKR